MKMLSQSQVKRQLLKSRSRRPLASGIHAHRVDDRDFDHSDSDRYGGGAL